MDWIIMIGDLSHVGMNTCYFCNEPSEVLIDRRLKKTLPRNIGVMDMRPCTKCEDFMKQGILLMSIKNDTTDEQMQRPIPNPYRTGGWVIIKQEAIERMFSGHFLEFALKHRFMFINDEAWDTMELPRNEIHTD